MRLQRWVAAGLVVNAAGCSWISGPTKQEGRVADALIACIPGGTTSIPPKDVPPSATSGACWERGGATACVYQYPSNSAATRNAGELPRGRLYEIDGTEVTAIWDHDPAREDCLRHRLED